MTEDLAETLLDTIKIISDNAAKKTECDKTIKAIVKGISSNKYTVQYGPTTFTAVGETDKYKLNQEVYVLIPQGDWTLDKQIIGTTLNYIDYEESSTSSDRNLKTNITDSVPESYLTFYDKLTPVTFNYKLIDDDKTHIGLIAQDVETSLNAASLDNEDFAGLKVDKIDPYYMSLEEKELNEQGKNYKYALNYNEFIFLNMVKIKDLENTIKLQQEEISSLKDAVKELMVQNENISDELKSSLETAEERYETAEERYETAVKQLEEYKKSLETEEE